MHPPRLILNKQIYFLTFCTYKRIPYFNNNILCKIILENLNYYKEKFSFKCYAWAIMYDHLHLLIEVKEGLDVSRFLNSFKGFTAKKIINLLKLKNSHIWQEGSFDHVIRNEKDFKNHYDYIHYNPVKHNIVKKPEDYLYSSFRKVVEKKYYEIGWGYFEPISLKNIDSELFGES